MSVYTKKRKKLNGQYEVWNNQTMTWWLVADVSDPIDLDTIPDDVSRADIDSMSSSLGISDVGSGSSFDSGSSFSSSGGFDGGGGGF